MTEAFKKSMQCGNCKETWLQSIPFGYIAENDEYGSPQIVKEEDTEIKEDIKCPACGTRSKIRWN